jgi:hypothetical protein
MNGRRYLALSSPSHTKSYIPVCQALGEVIFPDLRNYAVSYGSSKAELVDAQRRACRDATRSYEAIKARKSILSESVPLMEFLGKRMFECALLSKLSLFTSCIESNARLGVRAPGAYQQDKKRRDMADPVCAFLLSFFRVLTRN